MEMKKPQRLLDSPALTWSGYCQFIKIMYFFSEDGHVSWSCPGLDQHILAEEVFKSAVRLSALQEQLSQIHKVFWIFS